MRPYHENVEFQNITRYDDKLLHQHHENDNSNRSVFNYDFSSTYQSLSVNNPQEGGPTAVLFFRGKNTIYSVGMLMSSVERTAASAGHRCCFEFTLPHEFLQEVADYDYARMQTEMVSIRNELLRYVMHPSRIANLAHLQLLN